MKWIKLYEDFSKKNKLILLDGSSSSGKTTTTQKLGAKSFLKATKKDKIVVIGSDDFSNFENRIPYDHEGKGYDKYPKVRKYNCRYFTPLLVGL